MFSRNSSGIHFRHRDPYGSPDATTDRTSHIQCSHTISGHVNFLSVYVTTADYFINLVRLKGYRYEMPLCEKTFRQLLNDDRMRVPQTAGFHSYASPANMGDYAILVELIVHHHLGEKHPLHVRRTDQRVRRKCRYDAIQNSNVWRPHADKFL